jgi:hypothetical protein
MLVGVQPTLPEVTALVGASVRRVGGGTAAAANQAANTDHRKDKTGRNLGIAQLSPPELDITWPELPMLTSASVHFSKRDSDRPGAGAFKHFGRAEPSAPFQNTPVWSIHLPPENAELALNVIGLFRVWWVRP